MALEVRPFPADRPYREFARAISAGFLETSTEEDLANWERLAERDRMLAAWDGDRVVGGGAAITFRLTIPGGEVGAAGVTAVAMMPTHRRRGLLRELMRKQLDDVHERGEPVATLWASEGSIYQRFGYGPGTLAGNIHVERSRTAYRTSVTAEGLIRLLDADEAGTLLPQIFDRTRHEWPGFHDRTADAWKINVIADPERRRGSAGPKFFAVYEVDGAPEGYAIYRVREDWDLKGSKSTLEVLELIPGTNRALRDLWRFVFDIDLIHAIRAEGVPADHALLLLVDEPRRLGFTLTDALWVRLVDLAAALEARSYAADDELVLDVSDEFCPWNAGRVRLAAEAGKGRVESVRSDADLALDITDVAAVYLGAFSFAELARSERVNELRPGALERADLLFRTPRKPWSPFVF